MFVSAILVIGLLPTRCLSVDSWRPPEQVELKDPKEEREDAERKGTEEVQDRATEEKPVPAEPQDKDQPKEKAAPEEPVRETDEPKAETPAEKAPEAEEKDHDAGEQEHEGEQQDAAPEPAEQDEKLKESDLESKPFDGPIFTVYPQNILFKECKPGDYQVAKLRMKNNGQKKLTVYVQLQHRSFATSTVKCEYPQVLPDIESFSIVVDGGNTANTKIQMQGGETKDIELHFAPKSAEYPITCAKLLFFHSGTHGQQVPVTGVNGVPSLSVLGKSILGVSAVEAKPGEELRLRNDGTAPAFVQIEGGNPEFFIVAPGASEVFESTGQNPLKLKWGSDYLRLLYNGAEGKGEWAEMVSALGISQEQVETVFEDSTNVFEIRLDQQ